MQRIILKDLAYRPSTRCCRYTEPTDNWAARIAGCIGIVAAFAAFFWIYGLTVYRDEIAPPISGTDRLHHTATATDLVAPFAPAPDMHSAAIRYANSDVIHQPGNRPRDAAPPVQRTTRRAEPPSKKPRTVAGRLPPAAANSYASANSYSRPEIGTE